ncbi:hypothetical protein NQ315_008850 [Exocentrus adspersus]|uniref:SCP domain-containing protein n=1 Tax=Exocentrus adspersus TaxID=1586481 RepID=A0AAV8VDT7_9CUCU|nr:hypothetical protein NQ315_008850 [Exocentrus adspersus]
MFTGTVIVLFCFLLCGSSSSSSSVGASKSRYCRLPCELFIEPVSHTVCDRSLEKCGAASNCGSDFRVVKLDDDDRQYILDIHNYLRNKVALGYEKRGFQPQAANIKAMSYNKELEFIAQCWANTCNGNPLIHDVCRRTEEYAHVGQNLGFTNSSSPKIDIVKSIKDLTLLWYDEVDLFNTSWIRDTRDRAVKVGHYTQLIWADSMEIGCAATFYSTTDPSTKRKWHHLVFVCNYGPGGNFIGRPVYKVGKPCSKCPKGLKQNKKYKGLCGVVRNLNQTESFRGEVFYDDEEPALEDE